MRLVSFGRLPLFQRGTRRLVRNSRVRFIFDSRTSNRVEYQKLSSSTEIGTSSIRHVTSLAYQRFTRGNV